MKKRNLLSLVCIFNVATLYFNVAPKQTIIKKIIQMRQHIYMIILSLVI